MCAAREAAARQGVRDFVGENQPLEGTLGQPLEPHHALTQSWGQLRQARPLAGGEIGADFENRVTLRQYPVGGERGENRRRHAPGAGAELENLPAGDGQHFGTLTRQAAAEKIRHFGRGDKVTAGADLEAAGAVVPETRRIQRQLHETLERQPACRGRHLGVNERRDRGAVVRLLRRQGRQD